jgi:hypothetical protein
MFLYIQGVPGGKDNILGGHSIGHSKQKTLYEHVFYSERFPRYSHLTSDIAQQGGRDGQYRDPKPNHYPVKWPYLGNRSE